MPTASFQRIQLRFRFRLSAQASSSSWLALPLKRRPGSQSAPLVRLSRFVALEPMGLLPEVQKGMMVLPPHS